MQPSQWCYTILLIPLLCEWATVSEAGIKIRKGSKAVYCGACLGLVDEAEWKILQVDPKKTVQVGSFRVDPKGNQKLYQIPLARSELHLTEMLESVCEIMGEFAESYDRNARRTTYMRTSSRDGTTMSLQNIQITGDTNQQLKFACETVVEEYEEELIALLKEEQNSIKDKFCVETAGLCNARNVTDFTKKTTNLDSQTKTFGAEAPAGLGDDEGYGNVDTPSGEDSDDTAMPPSEEEEDFDSEGADPAKEEL